MKSTLPNARCGEFGLQMSGAFRRARTKPRPDNNGSEIAVACIALHVMKTAIALRIITMLFHYMRNNLRKFANAPSNWGLRGGQGVTQMNWG